MKPEYAFPILDLRTGERFNGMTLRDYFAAKALQGMLTDGTLPTNEKLLARMAYGFADAMLLARQPTESDPS